MIMWRATYLTVCMIGVGLALLTADLSASAPPDQQEPSGKLPPKASPSAKQPATAERIAAWIRELDDDRYTAREAATAALTAAGKEAIAPLAKAAAAGSLEVSVRCVAILERLAGNDDVTLADAAREALESLAPAGRTMASERAADALTRVYAKHAERLKRRFFQLGAVRGSGENFLRKDIERDDQLVITKKRRSEERRVGKG